MSGLSKFPRSQRNHAFMIDWGPSAIFKSNEAMWLSVVEYGALSHVCFDATLHKMYARTYTLVSECKESSTLVARQVVMLTVRLGLAW